MSAVSSRVPLQEESLPAYAAHEFYPVKIGATINARYAVLGKLGSQDHVALKIYVGVDHEGVHRERLAYEHLNSRPWTLPGCLRIRDLIRMFEIPRHDGPSHICLVHHPMHISLFSFQRLGGRATPLPLTLVKQSVKHMLEALDFLHREANFRHYLKLSNIMLKIEDVSVLTAFEEDERLTPSICKAIDDSTTIYASRAFRHPKDHAFGLPMLCDFGEARLGAVHPYQEIQPEIYKAPEILMQMHWSYSVDIWNLACVIWDMVEAKHLFNGYDEEGMHNNRIHMWEIVSMLGSPPQAFLSQSPQSWRIFDEHGRWKALPLVENQPLQGRTQALDGRERDDFIGFMLCMLRWLPEDRLTAQELLQHHWLAGC